MKMKKHTKDGFHFIGFALLDKSVKDDDMFSLEKKGGEETGICFNNMTNPGETKEIGIAMRAAFRPIDFVQVLQWKLEFRRQTFDSGAKISRGQWREFVDHGPDDGRVDNDHDELERDPLAGYREVWNERKFSWGAS